MKKACRAQEENGRVSKTGVSGPKGALFVARHHTISQPSVQTAILTVNVTRGLNFAVSLTYAVS